MGFLVGNGTLITHNSSQPIIYDGCVAVNNDKIEDFGTTAQMKAKYSNYEFFDTDSKMIMPGLINTHMHIYSAFARGMSIKNAPESTNFNEILENLWWRLDKNLTLEDVKYSAYATYIDCIKNGVTCVFDHHASPFCAEGSLFQIGDVAKELGIRTSLCYEVSDRDGEVVLNNSIKENIDFIKHTNGHGGNMLKAMFGLHASMTLSEETLDKCVSEAKGLNAGFHVHTAEGIGDLHDCLNKYGKRVVQRFFDAGILGEKSIAVHCVHINKAEMELLKETNTSVVHNPQSNMGNAVGCAPVIPLIDTGVTVGLGTDGYTSDMLESLKNANTIHKHHLCDPRVGWAQAPLMLFENNRKIAQKHFAGDLGVIEKGAYADIIVINYSSPTPLNENNINSHVIFGFTGSNVDSTIINGKFVYKNRQLQTADEREIYSKSREVAEKMWNRINR